MATQEGAITRHANSGVIRIAGEIVGSAININVRESGATDPTHTIGDVKPKEHVHNRYSVQVTVGRFVFKEDAANTYGVGGANLLKLPPVEIQGVDEIDGKVLFSIIECTLSDRDQAINANTRIQGNLTFHGIDVADGEDAPASAPRGLGEPVTV